MLELFYTYYLDTVLGYTGTLFDSRSIYLENLAFTLAIISVLLLMLFIIIFFKFILTLFGGRGW